MKDLLFSITKNDLTITYFSGTGSGGQHRNKHQNCVRIKHNETGIIVTGQSHRERKSNISEAFHNLVNNPKFRLWHTAKAMECLEGKTMEQRVDDLLIPENLKIEVQENGVWVEETYEN